jgi:ABC-type multidrug transport system permease subunit
VNTIGVLLWKDLRRAWRNPAAWLVFLAMPLVVTALVGLAFGPKARPTELGRIRFALVDEDDSQLTRILRGALNQREASTNLEAAVLGRAEALAQIQDDKLSGMVVIPAGFTRNYLGGTNVATFELLKNPAESVHPAVLEELLGVLVAGLDALKKLLGPELPAWQALFEGEADYHRVAELIVRAGDRLQAARKLLSPLRVSYTRQTWNPDVGGPANSPAGTGSNSSGAARRGTQGRAAPAPAFNLFAYLLPGLTAMFLLYLAEHAGRDVQRELQQRTLQRFRTLRHELYGFVASKAVFSVVFLLLSSAIVLVGGGLIFGIHWRRPLPVAVLTASYCLFAGGLMTLAPAVVRDARAAQVLGNVGATLLGLAGGSAFPAENFPALVRQYVCPALPNYWYVDAVRSLTSRPGATEWVWVATGVGLLGATLMAAAAVLLRRSLEKGPV